jgi:hypothetical protein
MTKRHGLTSRIFSKNLSLFVDADNYLKYQRFLQAGNLTRGNSVITFSKLLGEENDGQKRKTR